MATVLWPNGLTTPPPFSWQGHFGPRNANLSYASTYHRGQDFYGFSNIHAIADGSVVHVGRRAGWAGGGYMVWIQHNGFFSRYLHLAEGSSVLRTGQSVAAGAPVGVMGATNGGGYGMAVHLHLEITMGQWHAGNYGQIDPRAFLEARVGTGSSSGGGGGSADENDDLENDMRLFRIQDSKSGRDGRHYAIAPEYIKQITTAEAVKAFEDAFGVSERPISEWTLTRVLGVYGIPSGVLNGRGYVLDDLNGQGKHVSGGTWSRVQKVERLAYLAQK